MVLMNPLAGSNGDTDREQTCGHSREGEGGTNGESSLETYPLPHGKQIASGNLLYDAESSNLVLHDYLEGWDTVGGRFKKEGTYVCLWLIHIDVWQKPTQYYKAVILQLTKKLN